MGETSSAGPRGRPQGKTYGAALTTKQFFVLVTAIALGTLLEWYEFFVYAQLNAYLTKVFFPSSDPAVQQLSYWGVYAVGFIARPIGSIIFGHIGDTRGRRLNLLLTIIIMAVPTVLIGCLPTFDQIGIAAPALLAVLRLIQGLAMGGEFGSAMVYLHEIAPANMKGMMGSLGFCSAMFGCMLGVLIVVIMEAICSPSQMLVFGWRIPFLLSAVSATAAVALRMKMPEPHEFVEDRQTTIQHNLERIASGRSSTSGLEQPGFNNRFASSFSRQLSSFRSNSKALGSFRKHSNAAKAPAERTDTGKLSTPQTTHDLEKGVHTDTSNVPEQSLAAHQPTSPKNPITNPKQNNVVTSPRSEPPGHDTDLEHGHSKDVTEGIAADDVTKQGEYIPVVRLLRHHTPAVLLQFLFEAWVSVGFWVITTWLPIQMRKAPINMPEILTQAMLIVNLIIMGGVQVASGWLSDRGVPRVWFCFGIFTIAAGISCPVLLEMPRAGIAGAWLLHMLLMVIMAFVLGVIPATLSTIYPPSVRATGFNLGHNMAMSWLGGVSPTVVTALVAATGRTFLAPGLLLTASAGVSMVAALVLVWYAPEANGNTRRRKSAQLS